MGLLLEVVDIAVIVGIEVVVADVEFELIDDIKVEVEWELVVVGQVVVGLSVGMFVVWLVE